MTPCRLLPASWKQNQLPKPTTSPCCSICLFAPAVLVPNNTAHPTSQLLRVSPGLVDGWSSLCKVLAQLAATAKLSVKLDALVGKMKVLEKLADGRSGAAFDLPVAAAEQLLGQCAEAANEMGISLDRPKSIGLDVNEMMVGGGRRGGAPPRADRGRGSWGDSSSRGSSSGGGYGASRGGSSSYGGGGGGYGGGGAGGGYGQRSSPQRTAQRRTAQLVRK